MLYWGEILSPKVVTFLTMKSRAHFSFFLIALILLALASLALQPLAFAPQNASASPTPMLESPGKAARAPLEIQPGSSDGIFALGLFIWLIVVVPMFFLRKNFLQ